MARKSIASRRSERVKAKPQPSVKQQDVAAEVMKNYSGKGKRQPAQVQQAATLPPARVRPVYRYTPTEEV